VTDGSALVGLAPIVLVAGIFFYAFSGAGVFILAGIGVWYVAQGKKK
jgi:hypothetical protein